MQIKLELSRYIKRHRKFYLFLCLLIFYVYVLAFYIGFYPNQIYWSIVGLVLIYGRFLLWKRVLISRRLVKSCLLIIAYFLYLPLTSLWEVYSGTALEYSKFAFINFVIFVIFYLFSINFSHREIAKFFLYLSIPIAIFGLSQIFFSPEQSRYGQPDIIAICIPFILFIGNHFASILGIVSVLIAAKKGAIGMLIIGITLFMAFSNKKFKSMRIILIYGLLSLILILFVPNIRQATSYTFARFGLNNIPLLSKSAYIEQKDRVRVNIAHEFAMLYPEYWLKGMGYANFRAYYFDYYGRYILIREDRPVGADIHSIFYTWMLEGGLPLMIIGFLILMKYFKIVFYGIRIKTHRQYYIVCMIMMIQILFYGIFHSAHNLPLFWAIIGLVYADRWRG